MMSHFLYPSAPPARQQHNGDEVRRCLIVSVLVLLQCVMMGAGWVLVGPVRLISRAAALERP